MDTLTGTFVPTYFCPICGTRLEQFDFDKAPEDYSCPFCSSQLAPSRAMKRAGWGAPE
ncbi:MAG TPA: hypothetical protein VF984_03500 [Actinomycetota bacterium]